MPKQYPHDCPHVSFLFCDPLWDQCSNLSLGLCFTNVFVSDLFLSNLCPNGIVKIRINREVSRPSLPFPLLQSPPGIILVSVVLNSTWERQVGKMCG